MPRPTMCKNKRQLEWLLPLLFYSPVLRSTRAFDENWNCFDQNRNKKLSQQQKFTSSFVSFLTLFSGNFRLTTCVIHTTEETNVCCSDYIGFMLYYWMNRPECMKIPPETRVQIFAMRSSSSNEKKVENFSFMIHCASKRCCSCTSFLPPCSHVLKWLSNILLLNSLMNSSEQLEPFFFVLDAIIFSWRY